MAAWRWTYVALEQHSQRQAASLVQEPPEGNTAATLGINAAAPDGSIWMMQLPPMLPSLTLVEAAEQKAAAATNPADASATPVPKPALPLLSGPEVLHALPNGKVRAHEPAASGAAH